MFGRPTLWFDGLLEGRVDLVVVAGSAGRQSQHGMLAGHAISWAILEHRSGAGWSGADG